MEEQEQKKNPTTQKTVSWETEWLIEKKQAPEMVQNTDMALRLLSCPV